MEISIGAQLQGRKLIILSWPPNREPKKGLALATCMFGQGSDQMDTWIS